MSLQVNHLFAESDESDTTVVAHAGQGDVHPAPSEQWEVRQEHHAVAAGASLLADGPRSTTSVLPISCFPELAQDEASGEKAARDQQQSVKTTGHDAGLSGEKRINADGRHHRSRTNEPA
ncbi:hypothetical protein D9M70_607140 [compost metagenome]